MIYILFITSLVVYLLLKTGQVYYEYFSTTSSPKNKKDKHHLTKNSFPWIPQIIMRSFLKSKKPNWTIIADKSIQRKLSTIKGLLNFVSIFCIVSLIYSLFQLWLDTSTRVDIAKATILKIEETQFKIKDFINHFKIGFSYDLLLLILLITFAGLFPVLEKYKAKDKIKKYNKTIKNILYFLTISTSFTFFGNKIASEEEGRIGKLEIHKFQIIKNNKLLLKKINDAVADRVVNEIISSPEIENVLNKIEETKVNIENVRKDNEYKNYISVAPKEFISLLPLENFEANYNAKFDFGNHFEKAESKFQNIYSKNSSSQSDFYQAWQESNYTNFKERNKSWFNEKGFKESSAKQAEGTFIKATEKSSVRYSKYYSKYKEPIEKLLKKGYSNTGGKWIKDFFETLGVDLPFLDKLIDPIINEPIQDFILKKTETIFKACTENKVEAISSELVNCTTEFKETFGSKINNSHKFSNLKEQVLSDYNASTKILSLTKLKIFEHQQNADDFMKFLCSNNKWERYRIEFLYNLKNGVYSKLNSERKNLTINALERWENRKTKIKMGMYFSKNKNIESQFLNFTKNDPKLLITWAYCILVFEPGLETGTPSKALTHYFSSQDKSYDLFINEKMHDNKYIDEMRYANNLLCGKH